MFVCVCDFFFFTETRNLAEKVNRKEKERKRQEKMAAASAGKRAADEDEHEDDEYEGADAPNGDERPRGAGGVGVAEQGASRQQEQVYELECPPYTTSTQFTHFTCVASTKLQILTPEELQASCSHWI